MARRYSILFLFYNICYTAFENEFSPFGRKLFKVIENDSKSFKKLKLFAKI